MVSIRFLKHNPTFGGDLKTCSIIKSIYTKHYAYQKGAICLLEKISQKSEKKKD